MHEYFTFVQEARRRWWSQRLVRSALTGVGAGCGIGLLVAVTCSTVHRTDASAYWIAMAVVIGGMVGLLRGLWLRPAMVETALAIDAAAGLKDRIHSALQFASLPERTTYHELQIRDAMRMLQGRRIGQLFPWRWPNEGTWATGGLALVVIAALLVPGPVPAEATLSEPAAEVQLETDRLEAELEQFEQLAEDLDSDDMREVAEELHRELEELRQDAVTEEEAMVHFARMMETVQKAAAEFDSLTLQQSLGQIGEGLTGLDGFNQAAEALKKQDYEQAARAFEEFAQNLESGRVPMPQSGGLLEMRIGQLGEQANSAGLPEMGEALESLRKAIRQGSRKECSSALKKLSSTVRRYGKRSRVGRAMRSQLTQLSERKNGLCKNCGLCAGCRAGKECEGGNCSGRGIKIGLPTFSFTRSKSGSQKAGTAVSGTMYGEKTNPTMTRSEEQVTGRFGDGPSETEIETTTDARQAAMRKYRDVYEQYRRKSDSVMLEEAVPLAHRYVIKQYFERIHPDRIDPETQLEDVLDTTATEENASE